MHNPARTSGLFYTHTMIKNITPHIITGTLPDFVTLEKALQHMPFAPTTGQRADDFDGNVVMATSETGQMLDELIAELDGVEK